MAATTGEKLVELSTLSTGTAMEHLLNIRCSGSNSPTIYELDIVNTTGVGVSDGQITILASGGTSPFEYSVGGAYQTGNTFTNLSEDTYTISVRDISGLTDTIGGIKLSAPANTPIITELITIDASSVGTTDGSIEVFVNGGTEPYEYALDNGIYQSSSIFMRLHAGTYGVSVKDSNGVVSKLSGIRIGTPSRSGWGGMSGGVNRYRPSIRIKNVKTKDVEVNEGINVRVTL